MPKHLVDTCVLGHFVNCRKDGTPRNPLLRRSVLTILENEDLTISIITEYEVRRGLLAPQVQYRRRAETEALLDAAIVIDLGRRYAPTFEIAADLYALDTQRSPGDADLLIAATAITQDRVLLTADTRLCGLMQRANYGRCVYLLAPDDSPGE